MEGRATTLILLSFIGLFAVCTLANERCTCNVDHPQQRYCNASYAFVGSVEDIEVVDIDYRAYILYTVAFSRREVFKGKELLSRDRFNQEIFTPYYGSLCGRSNLRRGLTYLFTGSVDSTGRLTISFCNWVELWDTVTDRQKEFLKDGVYDSNCAECRIYGTNRFQKSDQNKHEDYSDPLQMSGYWTRRKCHFNPLASATYRSPDCEHDLTFCSLDRKTGMCLWKWSDDYDQCFREREQMWQVLSGAQPAFTNIQQCREITNEKLKKKCRRAIRKQKKLERRARQQAALEAERDFQGSLPFDVDLD